MPASERNKTLTLTQDETQRLFGRCVLSRDVAGDLSSVTDKIVCGDAFEVAGKLPEKAFDLLIVDPPYNLTKNYGGEKFYKTNGDEYAEFTEKWIRAFYPALKPTASVYVCCDFMSGVTIAPLLAKYFKIRSRITWQREKGRGSKNNWKNGMEDVWFCTTGDEYFFDLASVKQRRRVLAPYRENGEPKDWFVENGEKYRDTCPSNFWDDITVPYWSMSENTAHPTQKPEKTRGETHARVVKAGRFRARSVRRERHDRGGREEARAALYRHREKSRVLRVERETNRTCRYRFRDSGVRGRSFLRQRRKTDACKKCQISSELV